MALRELYTDPTQPWSFVPSKPSHPQTNPAPSFHFPTRSSSSSAFQYPNDFDLEPHAPVARVLKALVASAVLQYTSTAIVMPWEVGKLLLQLQWVPRDAGEVLESEDETEVKLGPVQEGEEEEEGMSDPDDDNAESYFADPNAPHHTGSNQALNARPPLLRSRVDEHGYIIRRSVLEEGTRPEYIIPVGSASGVWGMIKRVGRHRTEGWLSLWKGLLTSCITEILSDTLQPLTHSLVRSLFFPSFPINPYHHSPSGTLLVLPVLSHLLTGFLLSPLDLIRTRRILQSSHPRYKTYPKGPLATLSKILDDEGGLKGVYFHPHLLFPTLLDNALRPIVALFLPKMLITYLGYGYISEDTHPIAWGLAELAGSCLGLLITLPVETIRRRLQAQVRGNGSVKSIQACVELRPRPYNGVVDVFWHILTEERSDLPIVPVRGRKSQKEKGEDRSGGDAYESWWKNTGLGQLYRGLGMRLSASAVVFALALLGGIGSGRDEGWAEI